MLTLSDYLLLLGFSVVSGHMVAFAVKANLLLPLPAIIVCILLGLIFSTLVTRNRQK